jgi:hypothetical protein
VMGPADRRQRMGRLAVQGWPCFHLAVRLATNGLAARPLPYGLKAFVAKRPVAQSDRLFLKGQRRPDLLTNR